MKHPKDLSSLELKILKSQTLATLREIEDLQGIEESQARDVAKHASAASRELAAVSIEKRNAALDNLRQALSDNEDHILEANQKDVAKANDQANPMIKRLNLTGKYNDMLTGITDVRNLDDPIGKVTLRTCLDDGLELQRVSCPIGVLLIIFEARPEVIANITALAIKSGNAAILKGGKESTESFKAIADVVSAALRKSGLPERAIQLVQTRDEISGLLAQDSLIDLVIPRGSNELVRHVKENTKIPVLGHADGICLAYIHADADPDKAVKVIVDSKTHYPAACNALETLLVHTDVLNSVFLKVATALLEKGVTLRCDEAANQSLKTYLPAALKEKFSSLVQEATDADYKTEFLDLTLAVKTIPADNHETLALKSAMDHINMFSSKHTNLILTESSEVAELFTTEIDSAGAFVNASTRFADGMRFGFGTEVGISTNKIHSRGPVGLEGLTIYKYILRGEGHRVQDYDSGKGGRRYKHKQLPLDDVKGAASTENGGLQ